MPRAIRSVLFRSRSGPEGPHYPSCTSGIAMAVSSAKPASSCGLERDGFSRRSLRANRLRPGTISSFRTSSWYKNESNVCLDPLTLISQAAGAVLGRWHEWWRGFLPFPPLESGRRRTVSGRTTPLACQTQRRSPIRKTVTRISTRTARQRLPSGMKFSPETRGGTQNRARTAMIRAGTNRKASNAYCRLLCINNLP